MNDQLHCGHICAAAFLAFGGQLRTTSAEDFHKRERGGERGERERERGRERGERERERGRERDWHLPRLMLTLRKLLSRKFTASFLPFSKNAIVDKSAYKVENLFLVNNFDPQ